MGYFTDIAYLSNSGEYELQFDEGGEFRMGCTVWWRARIILNGRDQSSSHQDLLEHFKRNHPYATAGLHPWNRADDKLALPTVSTLGLGFVVYDVAHSRVLYSCDGYPWFGSAWSPARDELFLAIADSWVVLDGSGEVRGRVTHHGPTDARLCGWTPSGDSFFYLEQHDGQQIPLLRFYDRETFELLDGVVLDPAVLIPYKQDFHAKIERDRYSLPMVSGATGVGWLLDEWSRTSMVGSAGQLQLAVARPSPSSPGRFEQQWISVEVTD